VFFFCYSSLHTLFLLGWIETFHIHGVGDFFLVAEPLQYFRVIQKFCCYLTYRVALSARLSQSWGFYCVPLECFSSTYLCQKRGPRERPGAHTLDVRRNPSIDSAVGSCRESGKCSPPSSSPSPPAQTICCSQLIIWRAARWNRLRGKPKDPQVSRKINLQM
jgi:hypothetical protein